MIARIRLETFSRGLIDRLHQPATRVMLVQRCTLMRTIARRAIGAGAKATAGTPQV